MTNYRPPSYLIPRPGEVRFKVWLMDTATALGIKETGVAMRLARGLIAKPKMRKINQRVIFVIPK